ENQRKGEENETGTSPHEDPGRQAREERSFPTALNWPEGGGPGGHHRAGGRFRPGGRVLSGLSGVPADSAGRGGQAVAGEEVRGRGAPRRKEGSVAGTRAAGGKARAADGGSEAAPRDAGRGGRAGGGPAVRPEPGACPGADPDARARAGGRRGA